MSAEKADRKKKKGEPAKTERKGIEKGRRKAK